MLLRFGLFLIVCALIQNVSAQPTAVFENQTAASENYAIALETTAKELGNRWNGAELRRSIDLYAELTVLYENYGASEKAAEALRRSAETSVLFEDYDEAVRKLEKSLALENQRSNHAGTIETLGLLALVYLQKGQIERSEKLLNEGLERAKSIDLPRVKALIYFSASELNYTRRNLDAAIEYAAQAAALWRQTGDAKRESEALRTLSAAYTAKDDFSSAQAKLHEALAASQKAGDRRGEALAQFQLAYFHLIYNEPQKALAICQYSASLFPDDLDFVEKARLFNGISTIYEIYGDWKSALDYRKKTLEAFGKGKYPNGELATLPSLIEISFKIGDQDQAFRYFQTAREASGKLKDKFYLANANLFVADFYGKNGADDRAIEYYQIARRHLEKLKYSAGISRIENDLGEIYAKQKKFSTAHEHFGRSLQISRRNLNKIAEAQTLFNLAKLFQLENKETEALQTVEESIALTDLLASQTVNAKLKSAYFSNVNERYALYTNLLMKRHRQTPNENFAVAALQTAERARARLMLENLALATADFTRDAAPEVVWREKTILVALNSKADRLTDFLSAGADAADIERLDGEIRELERELEAINADLKQNSPIYSAIKNPAAFDVQEFQRTVLDDDSMLLEFAFGIDESYLWLIGKTTFEAYVLPARAQIERRVERLREATAARETKPGEAIEDYQKRIVEAEAVYQVESRLLSVELFGQIADKLPGKRLIVVPDGKLHFFPIAALPFPNSIDDAPILLTNTTIYEPSAATLALLVRNREKVSRAPKNLLVFSDPIFSRRDARIETAVIANESAATNETALENEGVPPANARQTEKSYFPESLGSLARLDATHDEAEAIRQIVGESASTWFGGAAATRENVLDASIADYKIVHFATHGLIDDERPELSGIVLSQLDESGRSRNGVVRLQDIYQSNLVADTVVLSACGTGLGKTIKGEGVQSLNNAFLQAGAQTVVSSLWKVDDYATGELMKNFYRELTGGTVTTAEALRRAQIDLRRNPQFQSPFFWAAFTVQGNFQAQPQLTEQLDRKIYALLIFPLATATIAVAVYLGRRRRRRLFDREIINEI